MSVTVDLSTVPGAMQTTLSRTVGGGLIEFEFAPAGWLTKAGEARLRDWRAYYLTKGGKRTRLPSVTTLLDSILPKAGLPPWAEARGIEGAIQAVRIGEIDPHDERVDAVATVRALRLGADRARDDAAGRGLNVHAVLERYAQTAEPPDLSDHPPEEWGYVQGLTRWLLHARPEPLAIEQLVASAEHGYAGRLDLKARIGGLVTLVDLKTQASAGIYESAHLQARMYDIADRECGGEGCSQAIVVVVAENGEFREMPCAADERAVLCALDYYRALRPIASACQSANRVEREARR